LNISILIEDEQPYIHKSLKTCLIREDIHYQVLYASDEKAAQDILQQEKIDFFICPLALYTGGSRFFQQYPELICIALIKDYEREAVVNSLPYVHHFINEPIDIDTLKQYIERIANIRHILGSDIICRLCTRLNDLPSLPGIVYQVIDELSLSYPSIAKISRLIEHDSSIASRIIQIVNSPAFGLGNRVHNIEQAIALLGLDMTKTIVIYAGINNYLHSPAHILATAESINNNSFTIGNLAMRITLSETGNHTLAQQAKIAGILNNIGYMLLLNNPQTQTELRNILTADKMTLLEAEQLLTGITHAELGAYFLGIRGFRPEILEAVAYYYRPQTRPINEFNVLTALHIAHVLAPSPLRSIIPFKKSEFHLPYLDRLGLLNRIETWELIAEEVLGGMVLNS